MAAAGLQRSETFRRSGSSGLVWEDRLLLGKQPRRVSDGHSANDADGMGQRGDGGVQDAGPRMRPVRTDRRHWRTNSVSSTQDPPSPRISSCLCWTLLFGKSKAAMTKSAAAIRSRQR